MATRTKSNAELELTLTMANRQLLDTESKYDDLKIELEKVQEELNKVKESKKVSDATLTKYREQIEEAHSILDIAPGVAGKKTSEDGCWAPERSLATRLSSVMLGLNVRGNL